MTPENIEERVAELDEVDKSIVAAAENAKKEFAVAKSELQSLKALAEIEKFVRLLLEDIAKQPTTEERFSAAFAGLSSISDYTKNESARIKDRVVILNERISVLESTASYLTTRKVSLLGKKAAIERVVDGTGDPRHPEKISTIRNAEKVRKQHKSDS